MKYLQEYEPILGKDAGNVVPGEKLEQVLDAANLKGTPSEIEQSFDTSSLDGWNELCNLYDSLKNRGTDNIRINFGIVRGLDYYSGIVLKHLIPLLT